MSSCKILLLALLLISPCLRAGEFEFMAGANYTTYDAVPEANGGGLSVYLQYNFSTADSGWILNYYGPAESFSVGELRFGYEWKSQGPFYFQGGFGGSYSRIWGARPMFTGGVGYRISNSVFIDLRVMQTSNLTVTPYIGITF